MPRPEGAALPGVLRPDWPAPNRVHALFTTRAGGVSRAPFDTLNLGDHVCDDPQAVSANRAVLARALGRAKPVFLQQVHGTEVVTLNAQTPNGTVADACLSTDLDLACTIMVADCLPVLLTNATGSVVAAAHAGWRGLAGQCGVGVLETTVAALTQASLGLDAKDSVTTAADVLVWLGPCIGPQAFEVGPMVRDAFVSVDSAAEHAFVVQTGGKYLADLSALARLRLQALGVTQIFGNDSSERWCTAGQASDFFSHRRDAVRLGSTGRMAACIWLT